MDPASRASGTDRVDRGHRHLEVADGTVGRQLGDAGGLVRHDLHAAEVHPATFEQTQGVRRERVVADACYERNIGTEPTRRQGLFGALPPGCARRLWPRPSRPDVGRRGSSRPDPD